MPLTLVLSVGSDSSLLRIRNQVLQSAGYIVVSASSVGEAVDGFRTGDFDLVILCHSIPTMDRNNLACWIRASGSHTPVVSISRPTDLYQCDAFADATLEDDAHKFLIDVREVLIQAARTPAANIGYEQQQREIKATEGSFAPLAHAGGRAVSG